MPRYKYVNDFSGPDGRFPAGTEIELEPGHRLIVDGFVVPVEGTDWERNEAAARPVEPEQEVDDLPDDAPVAEVEDKVKRVIHRKAKKG